MIETALRQALLQAPGVAALVVARIYPVILPQAPTLPAITYKMITNNSEYAMEGASSLASPRFQLDLYAGSSEAVIQLRNAVMTALSGTKGVFGSPPVRIQGIFRTMELDAYVQQLETSGPVTWRKTLDFNLWFEEVYDDG